jgi:hypothetical protein
MKGNKNNSKIQLEISNLIDNAINNAVARRNPDQDSEDSLFTLSDEETANVAGGFEVVSGLPVKGPIINGGLVPPILELI